MTTAPSAVRRAVQRCVPLALAAVAALALAAPAQAQLPAEQTGTGAGGQTLTVSQTDSLDPAGTTVTVAGTGFDETTGIYVAQCVDNGPGQRPTPCIGGVDMSGEGGSSAWVSSNPPSYGEGLTTPFSDEGSFELTLTVRSSDEQTDCLDPASAPNGCVVAAFADHTRLQDRSADVLVPITFGDGTTSDDDDGGGAPEAEPTTPASETESTTEPDPATPEDTEAATPIDGTVEATEAAPSPTPTAVTEGSGAVWLYLVLGIAVAGSAVAVIVHKVRLARQAEARAQRPRAEDPRDGGPEDDA